MPTSDSTHDSIAEESIRKRERRRLAIGMNIGAALALAAALVVMVNYLSSRHYQRYDWSRSKYYALSDKTMSLLGSLTGRVDVVVFFQPGQNVYEDVVNLLKEYEEASGLIHVEKVDPDRDIARTDELARKYQVDQANVVVFDYNGRSKFVNAAEIVEMDYSGMMQGRKAEMTGFKGEQAFSSAIENVTRGRVPVVYFLAGHGEGDTDDRDATAGFSFVRQQIERDNVEVRTFRLGDQQAVPGDADAVVIAGPKKRLAASEIEVLRKYLERSGRLIVLLSGGADAGLDELLEEWGFRLGNDAVIDPAHTLSGLELFIDTYGPHPITKGLGGISSIFYMPRSVAPADPEGTATGADKPHVTSLMSSTADSWSETDLEQRPMRFDSARDRKGPISVAAAAERGPVQGLDVDIRPTRLVVFGDADFVSNFAAPSGGNIDLFLGALNWVLEREELLAIAPKSPEDNRLLMDEIQLRLLFWVVVVGLPGIFAIIGGMVWLKRRN